MKLVIVFDLDDTLYPEVTYVESGFKAVAEFLQSRFNIIKEESLEFMINDLKNGRGSIFNKLLEKNGLLTKEMVKKCIAIYRTHVPDITLGQEAIDCLEGLKEFPKYIVTDGNKLVQYNKTTALGVARYFKRIFITHRFGVDKAKPSPYCFEKICKIESVPSNQVVYIGDNPNKDFVTLKSLGFKTIRILTGHFKDLKKEKKFEADIQIKSLTELTPSFFRNEVFRHLL